MLKRNYDFLILGGNGMQGKIVTRFLSQRGYRVLVGDIYKNRFLSSDFKIIDVRSYQKTAKLIKKVSPHVVINCAESDFNYEVYKACLLAKAHVIDLGSDVDITKNQLKLNNKFKKEGITAITGCGSTPGINNLMLKYAERYFDSIETIEAGFAWLPNMNQFTLPFSIGSILYEFSQPAVYLKNGQWKEIDPLKTVRLRNHKNIGVQKTFLVHHPEVLTFSNYCRNKGIKNIRFYASFPNSIFNVITSLVDLGFHYKTDFVTINGKRINPIDILAEMCRKMPTPEKYSDKENLWVNIYGKRKGKNKNIKMNCMVETLPQWEADASNIDTGFPLALIALMIKDGIIIKRGSFSPEEIVPEKLLFAMLSKYKMKVYKNNRVLN